MARFLLGINYWPLRSAMYMWRRFDAGEIREDMARIAELGLGVVRFFLSWEAFQPEAAHMDPTALRRFDTVMNAVAEAGLQAMPTLFCGHMSGVNWLPAWSLDARTVSQRFRTIVGDVQAPHGIRDFYGDAGMLEAQRLFACSVGERARDHPALLLWDVGNEFSNLREPRTPAEGAAWSAMLSETLRESSGADCTGGMHGEDLERDRSLRPSSMARLWSFATMHGYSVYSAFARGRLDTNVVPFLCQLQQSFAGKPVLFSEFGNPQCPPGERAAGSFACLSEDELAAYARGTIERLHARGALGAFWWCWADYDPSLADVPPFDLAPHELHFGIVRSDGSYKPVATTLAAFSAKRLDTVEPPAAIAGEADHYASLPQGIRVEYRNYCQDYA